MDRNICDQPILVKPRKYPTFRHIPFFLLFFRCCPYPSVSSEEFRETTPRKKKSEKPRKKKQFFSRPNHEKKSKLTFQRLLPLLSLFSYLGTYPSLSNIFFSCYLLPLSKKENSILNMNLDNTSYVQIVWRKTIQILTINLGKKTTMIHVN